MRRDSKLPPQPAAALLVVRCPYGARLDRHILESLASLLSSKQRRLGASRLRGVKKERAQQRAAILALARLGIDRLDQPIRSNRTPPARPRRGKGVHL